MKNNKINKMLENTTIAFSGFNMRYFAVVAIESFLLHYPEMRKNIVYFDDNSTDKTVKDLERRGIKVISWSEKAKKGFNQWVEKDYFNNVTQNLSTRVSYIMNDIMEQVDTKYLFFSDGDVIFKKGEFLEKYLEDILDVNLVFHEESSAYDFENKENMKKEAIQNGFEESLKYYEKYEFISKEKENTYNSLRFHYLHSLVDLSYLKENNLMGDRLDKRNIDVMHGGIVDTGTDFYHRMMEHGIKYKTIDHEYVFRTIYHFGWISSSNRDIDLQNANSVRNQVQEIKNILSEKEIENVLRRINIKPIMLVNSYETSQKNKLLKT